MSYKSENVKKPQHKKFTPPPQSQATILSFLQKSCDLSSSDYGPMPKVALLTSFHGTETAIGHAIRSWVLLFGLGNVSIFCKTNKLKTNILYYTEHTPVIIGFMTLLFYSLCEMGYFL